MHFAAQPLRPEEIGYAEAIFEGTGTISRNQHAEFKDRHYELLQGGLQMDGRCIHSVH